MNAIITYFEIAAFISSLAAWPYIRKSGHLRIFPFLLFVVVSVEISFTFFKGSLPFYNVLIYNLQVPLQHLLYLCVLYLSIDRKFFKTFILVFIIGFILVTIVTLIMVKANRSNAIGYSVGSIFIIAGILFKFHEMLQNPTEFNFLRNPFFYMLFAFLLFNVGTLPYFTMGNWIYFTLKRPDILTVLANVMSVFNYILYGTYTIAFLWMIRGKASY